VWAERSWTGILLTGARAKLFTEQVLWRETRSQDMKPYDEGAGAVALAAG